MASRIEPLGASHLANAGYEVQRTNNFEIQIEGVSEDKKRPLILSVVSGFLPNESNEAISLNYGNTTVTVAGKANVNGSGSLVVRDLVEQDIEKVIDDWRATVYNKATDAIGFAAEYKKMAYVTQYAPDGTLVRTWQLFGVWPQAVDYGQVSYDSPGVKTISITLNYDKAIIDRSDYQREQVTAGSLNTSGVNIGTASLA